MVNQTNLAWNPLIQSVKNYQFLTTLPYVEAKYKHRDDHQRLLEY